MNDTKKVIQFIMIVILLCGLSVSAYGCSCASIEVNYAKSKSTLDDIKKEIDSAGYYIIIILVGIIIYIVAFMISISDIVTNIIYVIFSMISPKNRYNEFECSPSTNKQYQ